MRTQAPSPIEGDVAVIFDEMIAVPVPPDFSDERPEPHHSAKCVRISGLVLLVVLAVATLFTLYATLWSTATIIIYPKITTKIGLVTVTFSTPA